MSLEVALSHETPSPEQLLLGQQLADSSSAYFAACRRMREIDAEIEWLEAERDRQQVIKVRFEAVERLHLAASSQTACPGLATNDKGLFVREAK